MGFLPTLAIIAVVGIFIVLVIALLSYVSNLVKQAYEIKVDIKRQVDNGLQQIDDQMNQRSRWIKRDLLNEIEKIKSNNETAIQQRAEELAKQNKDMLEAHAQEQRQQIRDLEDRLSELRKRLRRSEKDIKGLLQTVNVMQALLPENPMLDATNPEGAEEAEEEEEARAAEAEAEQTAEATAAALASSAGAGEGEAVPAGGGNDGPDTNGAGAGDTRAENG